MRKNVSKYEKKCMGKNVSNWEKNVSKTTRKI
jgi:hypothetical protein